MNVDELVGPARWLRDATDADELASALRAAEPSLVDALVACKVRRMRLASAGDACTGVVDVEIRRPGQSPVDVSLAATVRRPSPRQRTPGADRATGGAGVAFGSSDWWCELPDLGVALRTAEPQVELATFADMVDASRAPALLTAALRTGTRADDDVAIVAAQPTVMRYNHGSRCTVRYDVVTTGSDAHRFPAMVVGKTHRGGKGRVAHEAMTALWASPLRTAGAAAIAEPLGFDVAGRVLVQGPLAEETTITSLVARTMADPSPILRTRVLALVERAGVAAAQLHACGLAGGETVGIDDELAEARGRLDRVAVWFPAPARRLGLLLDRATLLAHASPASAVGPAHRSLRPAQFLVAGDRLGLIDFDGFCVAEPAIDVALFTMVVRSLAVGVEIGVDRADGPPSSHHPVDDRLAVADGLCAAFVAGYREGGYVSEDRLAAWEAAYLVSFLLASWTKLKLERVAGCLRLLDHHAARYGLAVTGDLDS